MLMNSFTQSCVLTIVIRDCPSGTREKPKTPKMKSLQDDPQEVGEGLLTHSIVEDNIHWFRETDEFHYFYIL